MFPVYSRQLTRGADLCSGLSEQYMFLKDPLKQGVWVENAT